MNTSLEYMKKILADHGAVGALVKRNILKDYIQVQFLDIVYRENTASALVFYGGSSLVHCYGMPRLSEDLDFVDLTGAVDHLALGGILRERIHKEMGFPVAVTHQKFRSTFKFPILKELGLAHAGDSDQLFLKFEIWNGESLSPSATVEVVPIFKHNKSILVRTFDLPTLMATKLNAVLYRKWEKTDKNGKVLLSVKGRDYYDLMWYLGKGIRPNLACVQGVASMEELKDKLLTLVAAVDEQSISLDLEPLLREQGLAGTIGKNIKEILHRELQKL